jgi:hypothetical protein
MDTNTGIYSPQRQGGRGVWPQMAEKTQIPVSDRYQGACERGMAGRLWEDLWIALSITSEPLVVKNMSGGRGR